MHFAAFISMKNRLVAATVLACGTVLVIAFASLAFTEIDSVRRSSLDKLTTIAKIVGPNAASGLASDDSGHAERVLSALRTEPYLEYADIHSGNGNIFAVYYTSGRPSRCGPHPMPGRACRATCSIAS